MDSWKFNLFESKFQHELFTHNSSQLETYDQGCDHLTNKDQFVTTCNLTSAWISRNLESDACISIITSQLPGYLCAISHGTLSAGRDVAFIDPSSLIYGKDSCWNDQLNMIELMKCTILFIGSDICISQPFDVYTFLSQLAINKNSRVEKIVLINPSDKHGNGQFCCPIGGIPFLLWAEYISEAEDASHCVLEKESIYRKSFLYSVSSINGVVYSFEADNLETLVPDVCFGEILEDQTCDSVIVDLNIRQPLNLFLVCTWALSAGFKCIFIKHYSIPSFSGNTVIAFLSDDWFVLLLSLCYFH